MRPLLHIGLAALIVIAPAFCCCNLRLFAGHAVASVPDPEPAPPPSPCCKVKAKTSCCHDDPAPVTPKPQPVPLAPCCQCLGDRPDANLPEAAPTVAAPEPTGELIPVTLLGLAGIPPEHLGLIGGLDPPERAGVDTRSAALFDRHVLRC